MQFIPETSGHIHTPRFSIPDDCTTATCKHCGRLMRVNESGLWQLVALEPSDFKRRKDVGDYLVYHPDRDDDRQWLACVWNMSGKGHTPDWRHDRMMLSAPSFRTMRECIADRIAAA